MKTQSLEQNELKHALKAIGNRYGLKARLLIELNSLLGFRIGDFLAITREQYIDALRTQRLAVIEQKTKKTRQPPIKGRAVGLMRRLLEMTPDNDVYVATSTRTKRGRHISKASVFLWFKHAQKALETINVYKNIASHSLRKTCGRILMAAGVQIEKVAKFFNHSDTKITMIYLDLQQSDADDCFNVLNC